MLVPNPRFDMPSLFYPGRKPTGNVQIDWENPITDGLTNMLLMDSYNIVDLAKDRITEVLISGLKGSDAITSSDASPPVSQFPLREQGTVIFDGNMENYTVAGVFLSLRGGLPVNIPTILYRSSDTAINFRINDNTVALNSPVAVFGSPETVTKAFTWDDSTNTREMYINGDFADSSSTAFTWVSQSTDEVILYDDRSGGGNVGGSLQKYLMNFSRVLSPTEISSLKSDPYQFLIPA